MAKKSIGIVEQHVEKVVLGVGVLYLLAVAFLYLVSSPNSRDFDGQMRSPGQIDLAVLARAEMVARDMRRQSEIPGDRVTAPNWEQTLAAAFDKGPIETYRLAEAMTGTVRWGQKVERVEIKQTTERKTGVGLAQVLPPSPPEVKYVRTLAALGPDPNQETPARNAAQDREPPVEQDINLVTIESNFDVAKQKELMEKTYNYPTEMSAILFAVVQVQRQERLGADWGEWEDISTYRATRLPVAPTLKMINDTRLSSESIQEFGQYVDALKSSQIQADVVAPLGPARPSGGPSYEAGRGTGSRVESALRDRLADRDRAREQVPLRTSVRGLSLGGERSAPAGSSGATDKDLPKELKFSRTEDAAKFIEKTLAEAESALKAQKFDDAKDLAEKVLIVHQTYNAASLKEEQRATEILRATTGERGGPGGVRGAEPVQQVRAFDISAEPGRTYRYRLRVGLLNFYVIASNKLKDLNDATKPILFGEWSEPSGPVSIERDTYFFVVGKDTRKEAVRVDVFKWYLDGWIRESLHVETGDEIGGRLDVQVTIRGKPYREEVDFYTGAVAVDMNLNTPFEPVQAQGEGFRLGRARETEALVFMDEEGQLHEHYAVADKNAPRYRELMEATKSPKAKPIRIQKPAAEEKPTVKGKVGARSKRYSGASRSRGRTSRRY